MEVYFFFGHRIGAVTLVGLPKGNAGISVLGYSLEHFRRYLYLSRDYFVHIVHLRRIESEPPDMVKAGPAIPRTSMDVFDD